MLGSGSLPCPHTICALVKDAAEIAPFTSV